MDQQTDAKSDGIHELGDDELVHLVREWADREVKPGLRDLEHANTYPEELIEQMKEMGVDGLAIPEPWGDGQISARYALMIVGERTNEIQKNVIARQPIGRNRLVGVHAHLGQGADR